MFHLAKQLRLPGPGGAVAAGAARLANGGTRAVERALDVLLEFARDPANHRGDLGISDLSRRLGLPKATVYRLVETLTARGFLIRDAETGRCRLGPAVFRVGSVYLQQLDLRRAALPVMREFARLTGETVNLNVAQDRRRVCIEKIESDQDIRHFVELGRPMPLYAGASGRVLLAFMDPVEIEAVIAEGLRRLTPRTITDPARLRADLAEIRRRGYAVSVGERVDEACAVSAPVRDASGRVVAGLTISGPAYRFRAERVRELTALVLRGAAAVSAVLGHAAENARAGEASATRPAEGGVSTHGEVVARLTRFLDLVAARRLSEAEAFLAPGAAIVFPGGVRFASLQEMADAVRRRYRRVRKRVERWDVLPAADRVTVYCLGMLEGEDGQGRPFMGVRFVDRFEVRDGHIVRHEVWNDLAERGVV